MLAGTEERLHLGQGDRGRFLLPLDALCRHAVCLGATGSGKTALCLALLEEVASRRIPIIALDPKGDVANLLLTFPGVSADALEPWLDDRAVARAGDRRLAAEQEAARWRAGLEASGVELGRIEALRASVDLALFTPGSGAGRPLSVFGGLAAPADRSPEALRERSQSTAAALLSLVGLDAQPSRELALLSALLLRAWEQAQPLDLPGLIRAIQRPPFASLGALELSSYFPERERFELVLAFNHLLATSGAAQIDHALSIDELLRAPDGRPRASVVRLSHLSDGERQAFVAALLGHLVSWLRAQPGSSGLRALLFLDEATGFLPPVASPPSKAPLMTLLKQGRSQGLGVVVASQNPADLDYKALSNAGTWLIGRLATARDRQRVREALEGSGASLDLEATLAALPQRRFLCHGYWGDPEVFEARWTLSYLRGPIALQDLSKFHTITAPRDARPAAGPPVLPPGVRQVFLDAGPGDLAERRAWALAVLRLGYHDRTAGIDEERELALLAPLSEHGADWEGAELVDLGPGDLRDEPSATERFAPLPAAPLDARAMKAWQQGATQAAARVEGRWWRSDEAGQVSGCDEAEERFRGRLGPALAAALEGALVEARARWGAKRQAADERVRKAEQALARAKERAARSKADALLSAGATLLGGLLGGGRGAGHKAPRAIKDAARARHASNEVERAAADLAAERGALAQIDAAQAAAEAELRQRLRPEQAPMHRVTLRPQKGRITALFVGVVWRP